MAGRRPVPFTPPPHWTNAPPPEPETVEDAKEHGGPKGHEPTRYGDWESRGICWDF